MGNISFNGFYEHMPYTDFQTLNLDWVYSKINGILEILSKTNPDIENNILFAKNREELASTHYEPGTYVFAMGKDAPGDAGAALYKIVPADGSNTPAAFPVASGKAILQTDDTVNIAQLAFSDFSDAVNWAATTYKVIHIPRGEYTATKPLVFSGVRVIGGGVDRQTGLETIIHGNIILTDNSHLSGLYLTGDDTGDGYTIESSSILEYCIATHFENGFHVTDKNWTVNLTFQSCRASYNTACGFLVDGTNKSAHNLIKFDNCYANKNGPNADNTGSAGTPNTGYGYLINQANNIQFTHNVAEYNTGMGLMLHSEFRSSSDTSYIMAGTISNNYFEQNKICQIGCYMSTYGTMNNCSFADNFFTMPLGAVSNTLENWRYNFDFIDAFFDPPSNNTVDIAENKLTELFTSYSANAGNYGTKVKSGVTASLLNGATVFTGAYMNMAIAPIKANQCYMISFKYNAKSGDKFIVSVKTGKGEFEQAFTLTGTGSPKDDYCIVSSAYDTDARLDVATQSGDAEISFSDFYIRPCASYHGKPKHPQNGMLYVSSDGSSVEVWEGSWVTVK